MDRRYVGTSFMHWESFEMQKYTLMKISNLSCMAKQN